MATIILEIQRRGLNQYHRLESFPVTIGRSFDNDIILSDNSISPHHLRIEQDAAGELLVYNLSEENGTLMNRQRLEAEPAHASLPSRLVLGNRKLRLLSADMSVESTHVSRCAGIFAPLCNPLWAVSLAGLTLVSLLIDTYLNARQQKDMVFYLSNLLPELLWIMLWVFAISGITRLITHRWAFMPALSVVSLFTLLPLLLSEAGHWLDYFFTSSTPSTWLVIGIGEFFLLPFLLYAWLRRVISQKPGPALGLALLLSALPLGLQALNVLDQINISKEFSADASYNSTLSSLNTHANPTLSLDEYLLEARRQLPTQLPEDDTQ